jgi:hypothetical protein
VKISQHAALSYGSELLRILTSPSQPRTITKSHSTGSRWACSRGKCQGRQRHPEPGSFQVIGLRPAMRGTEGCMHSSHQSCFWVAYSVARLMVSDAEITLQPLSEDLFGRLTTSCRRSGSSVLCLGFGLGSPLPAHWLRTGPPIRTAGWRGRAPVGRVCGQGKRRVDGPDGARDRSLVDRL